MAKILTADEVKKHNDRKSVWMVIRNDVYDVTPFLHEHPGGEDPLLEAAGQDATIAFDDVGHSADARAMLKKYKVGTLAPGQGCDKSGPSVATFASDEKPWLRFDGSRASRKSSNRSCYKGRASPRIERRISTIVVPIEPRRGRTRPRRRTPPPSPPSGNYSKLKWALLALGLAIIIGVAYKRYSS